MLTAVDTSSPNDVVPSRMKNEMRKLLCMTSIMATEVRVATSKPEWSFSRKQVIIVSTAAAVYVIGELPNKKMNVTAYADPIAEAGSRMIPFLMESDTVGSMVTIAVMTANTAGQFSHWQIRDVRNTATPVLTIRLPANLYFFMVTTFTN